MKEPLDLAKLHGFKLLLSDRADTHKITSAPSLRAILGAKLGEKPGVIKIPASTPQLQ